MSTGEQALREIRREKYELILMDYQMPGMNGVRTAERIRNELAGDEIPKIILVTGHRREVVLRQAQEAGFDGFLLKPVSQSLLYDTIMDAFGHETEGSRPPAEAEIPKGLEKIRGARILLVEDNEINQQVAAETLQAEGFFVDVAQDGLIALEKVSVQGGPAQTPDSASGYDVVLMDLQMPRMDGYEATAEIRKKLGHSELPIIAMTADAMSGVRERALAVGLSDYVTKPIEPAELWASLVKWVKPGERRLPEGFQRPAHRKTAAEVDEGGKEIMLPEIEGIDTKEGLGRVSGNRKLFRELLVKFNRDFGNSAGELRDLLEKGDLATAERLAHTVKGVSGNIGARKLHERATALDDVLKAEREHEYADFLGVYEQDLRSLTESLRQAGLEEAAEQAAKKGGGEEIAPERLRELLEELRPSLNKRQPKRCAPILEEIARYTLPDEYAGGLDELGKLVKRYKFKEAQEIFERLMERVSE